MYKTELSDGGNVKRLEGQLTRIDVAPPDADHDSSKVMQMWIRSVNPENGEETDSLTWLSIEEAMNLSRSLNQAIKDTVNNFVTAPK